MLGLQLATVIFHGISEARPRKTRVSKLRSFLHSEKHEEAKRIPQKTLWNYPTANCSLGEISHRRTLNSQFTSAAHRRPTVMGEDGRICKQISNWFGIISIRFNISLSSLPLLGRGSWAENFSNLIGILSWGSGGAQFVHKQIFCVELTAFLSSNICAEEGKNLFLFCNGKRIMFSNRILTQRDMCLKWKKNISQRKTSLLFIIEHSCVECEPSFGTHRAQHREDVRRFGNTTTKHNILSPIPHYSIVVCATDDSLPLTVVDTFFHTEWKMWTLMITIMRPKPEDSHSCQVIAIDCVWFSTSHFTSSSYKRSPGAVTLCCCVWASRAMRRKANGKTWRTFQLIGESRHDKWFGSLTDAIQRWENR